MRKNYIFRLAISLFVVGVIAMTTTKTYAQAYDYWQIEMQDTDGDGVPNWADEDDDNDGILDRFEMSSQTLPVPVPNPDYNIY